MKRCLAFLLPVVFTGLTAQAQLKIDGATFLISSGATVTVQGDVTSNVDIQGTGLLQLKGTTLQNVDMGGHVIPNLELDNNLNANLLSSAVIGNSFLFTNGKAQINAFDLILSSSATMTGGSSSRFVITNGVGRLVKNSLGASSFSYPVGFSATEFNPLLIANNGTADNIGVRCMQNVLANGLSGGAVASDFANNSWVVSEAVPGGSNLNMSAEWVGGDELPGFNREKSGIARFNTGTDWDLPASTVIAASGSGPYSRSRAGVTTDGVFAVADLEKVNAARLNLKVFLQGSYSAATGLMSDGLKTNNVIPTTQPYSTAMSATRFNRVGVYDGTASVNESVPSTTVFDVVTDNDDIVDWVYVSLLDPTDPTIKLQTRAGLLQRDGDVVEYDAATTSYTALRMPIESDGNYHIGISHRNHLGVRTASTQALQDNVLTPYNFTTALTQAYDNILHSNRPMVSMTGTFPGYALWGGNVNANTQTRYIGPANDNAAMLTILGLKSNVFFPIYSLADVNMNGTVRYIGPANDNSALLNILGGVKTAVFNEHQ